MDTVILAVNGGLTRGMDSHGVMLDAGARFMREDATEPAYRLWPMEDRFPAMLRVAEGGVSISLEIYELPADGFVTVLQTDPDGWSVAHVRLIGGDTVLGVVGERMLCESGTEIADYGGWRAYRESLE